MEKDIIKKGFAEAEKQQQEAQITKIKEMVLKHLEKIAHHQEQAKEHSEKARLIKKDLDDLKAGRLDRIEERQEKDEKAKEVRIIEVHKIVESYRPLQPWYSPYHIVWATPFYNGLTITSGAGVQTTAFNTLTAMSTASSSGLSLSMQSSIPMQMTGAVCANFVGGSYSVNGNNINL